VLNYRQYKGQIIDSINVNPELQIILTILPSVGHWGKIPERNFEERSPSHNVNKQMY
jgi:hypothetical protein